MPRRKKHLSPEEIEEKKKEKRRKKNDYQRKRYRESHADNEENSPEEVFRNLSSMLGEGRNDRDTNNSTIDSAAENSTTHSDSTSHSDDIVLAATVLMDFFNRTNHHNYDNSTNTGNNEDTNLDAANILMNIYNTDYRPPIHEIMSEIGKG